VGIHYKATGNCYLKSPTTWNSAFFSWHETNIFHICITYMRTIDIQKDKLKQLKREQNYTPIQVKTKRCFPTQIPLNDEIKNICAVGDVRNFVRFIWLKFKVLFEDTCKPTWVHFFYNLNVAPNVLILTCSRFCVWWKYVRSWPLISILPQPGDLIVTSALARFLRHSKKINNIVLELIYVWNMKIDSVWIEIDII
jgi:hypothetical protein